MFRYGRYGQLCYGALWLGALGVLWQVRYGKVRLGEVGSVKVRQVWQGSVWCGELRFGMAWQVRFVELSSVMSRCAMARQVRQGLLRSV